MTRLFAGMALVSFSIVASAADKPLPVTVTNPVLPVEVSNADPLAVTLTTQAVNAHVTGAMPAYTVARDVYVNDGDKPVMFTALSV